jgi:hypothetical protein
MDESKLDVKFEISFKTLALLMAAPLTVAVVLVVRGSDHPLADTEETIIDAIYDIYLKVYKKLLDEDWMSKQALGLKELDTRNEG